MVSKNRHNNHSVSLPADWSLPKIHLEQLLQATTAPPRRNTDSDGRDSLAANP